MSADLYIKNMNQKKQYQNLKSAYTTVYLDYFKDDYNNYGLFNFLRSNLNKEFSWWQFADNEKWFDKKGNMTVKGAIEFKKIILQAKEDLSKKKMFYLKILNLEEIESSGHIKYNLKKLTKKEVKKFFYHLELLIKFLILAIKQKNKIIWNV